MSTITQYGSLKMTGSHPAKVPDGAGDLRYEQDFARDFAWLWDRIGSAMKDIGGSASLLVSGGEVTQGADVSHVNIAAAVGYAALAVDLGTDGTVPPATGSEDVTAVRVASDAASAIALAGGVQGKVTANATLNGSAVNYVKLRYVQTDSLTRNRMQASGSWYFTVAPDWSILIDTAAPTAYEVVLATLVGNGASTLTIILGQNMALACKRYLLTASTTLRGIGRFKTTGFPSVTLPTNVAEGDVVDIMADDATSILQSDANHGISYLNKYFTTKGAGGFLMLGSGTLARLIYKGSGSSRVEPGVKISDPAILPTSSAYQSGWSPNERYLAVTHPTTPFIKIYDWSTGVPVKIADPATPPAGTGQGVAWSPSGRYMAVSHLVTPYITVYDWSTGVPVKIADPATPPTGSGYGCAWSPDSRYIVVAHGTSPYITIYDLSTGALVKIANPGAWPTASARGACWSPDGRFLAVVHESSRYVTIYDWFTGAPVKIADPGTLPTGNGRGASWSPDGRYLVVAHITTPFITIYDWVTGSPVKTENPADLPPGDGYGASWSRDGRYLALACGTTPFMIVYKRTGSSIVKVADPVAVPGGTGAFGASYSPTGKYLVLASNGTPYVTIYKNVEDITKAWIVETLSTLNPTEIEFMFK
jgi:Tol biopolymer transport system component